MRKCPHCGAEVAEDEKVCHNCGKLLDPDVDDPKDLDTEKELRHNHLEPGLNIDAALELQREEHEKSDDE